MKEIIEQHFFVDLEAPDNFIHFKDFFSADDDLFNVPSFIDHCLECLFPNMNRDKYRIGDYLYAAAKALQHPKILLKTSLKIPSVSQYISWDEDILLKYSHFS